MQFSRQARTSRDARRIVAAQGMRAAGYGFTAVLLVAMLADRVGLVPTMVGTPLPSNMLLASVAFAPTFPVTVVLLLARTSLSPMDVPTRQALVITRPGEQRSRRQARPQPATNGCGRGRSISARNFFDVTRGH